MAAKEKGPKSLVDLSDEEDECGGSTSSKAPVATEEHGATPSDDVKVDDDGTGDAAAVAATDKDTATTESDAADANSEEASDSVDTAETNNPGSAYPTSDDGACPYCKSNYVQYYHQVPSDGTIAEIPDTVKQLILLGYAAQTTASEPNGGCYNCSYGFNFNLEKVKLEEAFAHILVYAKPIAPPPLSKPEPIQKPKFREYSQVANFNRANGKFAAMSNEEYFEKKNVPKDRDLRQLSNFMDVSYFDQDAPSQKKKKK